MFTAWDQTTGQTRRTSRSKNGCLTCRRRKVRCNEQRPRCSHCERLNLECKWNTAAARGSHRGVVNPMRNAASEDSPANQTQQLLPDYQPPVNELFNYASFMWDDPITSTLLQPSSPGRHGRGGFAETPGPMEQSFVPSPSSLILPNAHLDIRLSPEARDVSGPPNQPERRNHLICSGSAENDTLIEHFLRSVVPPILAPIETGPKWTSMRALFASMTAASSMVRGAMETFSALQLKVVDYRPFYTKTDEELSAFFEKSTAAPDKVRDQVQYMLATIFLVTYIDLVIGQVDHAHVNLRRTHLALQKVDKKNLTSAEKRLMSWVRLIDARAVSAGGDGLFLSDEEDSVYSPDVGQASATDLDESGHEPRNHDAEIEDILFDVIYQPGLVFFQKVQSFMGRISKIDRWHRSRDTVEDETEVMAIAAQVSRDLKALYKQRPALLDHAVAGHLNERHLAANLVPAVTRSFRMYLANYYASFVHLHRVAYKHLPRTKDVIDALSNIKDLVKVMSQSGEALPVNVIWPLLMLGCEEDDLTDRQWILDTLRGLEHVATNARITAEVMEEVQRRQDRTKERADIRQVMQDTRHSIFAIV